MDKPATRPPPLHCTPPASPLASSLQLATSTIDELTMALANFSRVPSPEPSPTSALTCCCGNDECDNLKTWLNLRNKLESRLTLSAEVGQALLERHEAYIRRTEAQQRKNHAHVEEVKEDASVIDNQYEDLLEEKESLRKRLNQALVNHDVVEVSNKTILLELQEAREVISRLSTSNARSIGWESRLAALVQEKEDMQQERDSESQKAKVAEARISALKERTGKLQAEVRRLQVDLEQRRIHRLESSDHKLKEARTRLEGLQRSHIGQSAEAERTELTGVLQNLVMDNEALKRDVGELQDLLTQSREEYNELQQEVEEQRASLASRPQSSLRRGHVYSASVSSLPLSSKDQQRRRVPSAEHRTRYGLVVEPLSPATTNRTPRSPSLLSPTESILDLPWVAPNQSYVNPLAYSYMEDNESLHSDAPEQARTRKTLLLLTRSRGVQTEPQLPLHIPVSFTSVSPFPARSESSSLSESHSNPPQASPLSALVDRISSLLTRLNQADALTLTNRLKRQHIQGADVSHISRSTVNSIISEVASLRTSYRGLLEDESAVTACTRRDLRGLFKIFREAFTSLAEMRITLNDLILDPTLAPKVSEYALGLSPSATEDRTAQGWMAPISKLFGGPLTPPEQTKLPVPGLSRSTSTRASPGPSRLAPKLEPALSATTTTVNVEFSGSGVGRNITMAADDIPTRTNTMLSVPSESTSTRVMGIFAGAPGRSPTQEPWIVVPREPRRMQSMAHGLQVGSNSDLPSIESGGKLPSRSMNASLDDTMLPEPGDELHKSLLERTLRRRGLSDSSMRSTFISHAESSDGTTHGSVSGPNRTAPWSGEETSMFSALTKRVRNLRVGAAIQSLSYEASNMLSSTPASSSLTDTNSYPTLRRPKIPTFNEPTEAGAGNGFFVGSAREDNHVYRRTRLSTGRGF